MCGGGGVGRKGASLFGGLERPAPWSPFPLGPETGFRVLQKTSNFTPSRGPRSELGPQLKNYNGPFGGMGPSEDRWAQIKSNGLLLAGGVLKSRANGVHLETMGPMGIDRVPDQYPKNPRASEGPVQRANSPLSIPWGPWS